LMNYGEKTKATQFLKLTNSKNNVASCAREDQGNLRIFY
jgi:hypothetical protein